MDLRTGRTYATREEAIAAGVPEADVVNVDDMLQQQGTKGPRQQPPAKLKFSGGSFKPVAGGVEK